MLRKNGLTPRQLKHLGLIYNFDEIQIKANINSRSGAFYEPGADRPEYIAQISELLERRKQLKRMTIQKWNSTIISFRIANKSTYTKARNRNKKLRIRK